MINKFFLLLYKGQWRVFGVYAVIGYGVMGDDLDLVSKYSTVLMYSGKVLTTHLWD